MATCRMPECGKDATKALRVISPKGVLQQIVYFDDRQAPKTATPYCKHCGLAVAIDAIQTVVEGTDG